MRSVIVGFLFTLEILWGGVNPFVIYNTAKIKTPQTVIPIPNEQRVWEKNELLFLVKPHETLYIIPYKFKKPQLIAYISLDGKLWNQTKLERSEYHNYALTNPYSQLIAVRFESHLDNNTSFYTTLNTSILNKIKGKEVILGGKRLDIRGENGKTTSHYDVLERQERRELNLTVEEEEGAMLDLSIRSLIDPLKNIQPYRQHFWVRIDGGKFERFEVFNGSSLSFVEDANQTPVSAFSQHFLALKKGEHNITFKTDSALLISAKLYHENIFFESFNKSGFEWEAKENLKRINQPLWRNSRREDGLSRFQTLMAQQEKIEDTLQQSALENVANKGTFMKALLPQTLVKGTNLKHLTYGIDSLYLEEEKERFTHLSSVYLEAHLAKLKEGTFASVPTQGNKDRGVEFNTTASTFYFRTREFLLDKGLERLVEDMVVHLGDYTHIYLQGHTDSTAGVAFNQTLSLKRCRRIKAKMMKLGIKAEDISIGFAGEMQQQISTFDETIEASNRRVEVIVGRSAIEHHRLRYRFSKPLSVDTSIEITLLNEDKNQKDITLFISNEKGKLLQKLEFENENSLSPFAFGEGAEAYRQLGKHYADTTLATLRNGEALPYETHTSTIVVRIPKGTKGIEIGKSSRSPSCRVSVRLRANATYKDSPYALAHHYANTFGRLAQTLQKRVLPRNVENIWYEQTHGLRLWILAQRSQAKSNLAHQSVKKSSVLDLAQKLYDTHDTIAGTQIAKQGLIVSKAPSINAKSYQILTQNAKDENERLKWMATYFVQNPTLSLWREIAQALKAKKEWNLAFDAFLLLPKSKIRRESLCELSLLTEQFALYNEMCLGTKRLEKRDTRELLNHKASLQSDVRFVKIIQAKGSVPLFNPLRDKEVSYYETNYAHPLEIEVNGSVSLELEIRFRTPKNGTEKNRFGWLHFDAMDGVYHLPLMQTLIRPMVGLKEPYREDNVSIGNTLRLKLGKGKHRFRMHGYESPLLVRVVKCEALDAQEAKPLKEQILQTSHFSARAFLRETPELSVVYASGLLWSYTYDALVYRQYAQAQGFLLMQKAEDMQIRAILREVGRYSAFEALQSLEAPLGFYDVPVPVYNPISDFEKNRLPLLGRIQEYAVILHGEDYKVIEFEGGQHFELCAKIINTDYFPRPSETKIAISYDGGAEKIIRLDDKNKTKTCKQKYSGAEGRHSIKMRMIEGLGTQWVGIKLFEEDEEIVPDAKKRYYASTFDSPITLYSEGIYLLRIEEIDENNTHTMRYVLFDEEKEHTTIFRPNAQRGEVLYGFAKLHFDPLKREALTMRVVEDEEVLMGEEREPSLPRLELANPYWDESNTTQRELPIEYPEKPTWSIGLKTMGVKIGSDDAVTQSVRQVWRESLLGRYRINESWWGKIHYFTNNYANALYGLKHTLYGEAPWDKSLTMILEANGYSQQNNGVGFRHFELRGEVWKKETFGDRWRVSAGIGAVRHWLEYGNPNTEESLDPLVYSRYLRDHQYGIYGMGKVDYTPYEDVRIGWSGGVWSNESLGIIDHLRSKLDVWIHLHPATIRVWAEERLYLEDRDRKADAWVETIGGVVSMQKWFERQRLDVEIGGSWDYTANQTLFMFGVVWHFSQEKRYEHFMPSEGMFNQLRMRLEDDTTR